MTENVEKYVDYYRTEFGQQVLEIELDFIQDEIGDAKNILSIGCGPAVHESRLAKANTDIEFTGVDISQDMLSQADNVPSNLNLVLGSAEQLDFEDGTFDLAYFLFSMAFVNDKERAVQETQRVLKDGGKALFMVANIRSWYIQKELEEENSYMHRKFRELDTTEFEVLVGKYFKIETSRYILGIHEERVFISEDPKWASLFVVKGIKH
jgi:ubiquinone/menaquinone biosynthesis C-methylase UbiE